MEEKLAVIQAWLTVADEKLEVAQVLFDMAYFNDATSHAYYAMFYAASATLASIDIEVKSHSGLAHQFSQHFIKTGNVEREYGRMLALAMRARELSDYTVLTRVSKADAAEMLANSRRFVSHIKELLADISK
jgi:uncharacterized protein (UPF0332 family)